MPLRTRTEILFNYLGLAVMLCVFILGFRYFDIETVRDSIEKSGLWAPLVLIFAKASTLVIAPLGGAFLYPLAGALFGLWKGAAYLMLGEIIGGSLSFLLSRMLGRKIVDRFFPAQGHIVTKTLRKLDTLKGLLIGRVVLMPYPELFSYIAGLTRARFTPFILIYAGVGVFPVVAGAALGPMLVQASSWQFAGLLFGIGIASAAGLYYWFARLDEDAADATPPASS